jgi:hypothetical protein
MLIFYLSCFGLLRPRRHMVVAPDGRRDAARSILIFFGIGRSSIHLDLLCVPVSDSSNDMISSIR